MYEIGIIFGYSFSNLYFMYSRHIFRVDKMPRIKTGHKRKLIFTKYCDRCTKLFKTPFPNGKYCLDCYSKHGKTVKKEKFIILESLADLK